MSDGIARIACSMSFLKHLKMKKLFLLVLLLLTAISPTGCKNQKISFTEVKRINEKLTREEIIKFLKIVQAMPDQKLPPIPPLYVPLPSWDASRTLSVSGLLKEEQEAIDTLWDEKRLGLYLRQNPKVMRVLNRFKITPEQFIGLTQTIGIAYNATTLHEKQDLKHLVRKSRRVLRALEMDERTFASLSDDVQHQLTTQAAWLTRRYRAERLLSVPKENVAVAKAMEETFSEIFPKEFGENAFDSIIDRLDQYGIPFAELPASGYDDEITWSPTHKEARIGLGIPEDLIVNDSIIKK